MGQSLVFSPRRPRWRWRCGLLAAALVALWLGLPWLVRGADALLAGHYAARLAALEADNAALHAQLAQTAGMAQENKAMRTLLGSERTEGSWQPAQTVARWPGGLLLAGEGEPGAAVLDRYGRYAGEVTAASRGLLTVQRGTPAGLVGEALGLLKGARLTGLPIHSGLAAGDVVMTPGGHWLGRLAEAPAADSDGLTAHAVLEDTADMGDLLYFVQR